MKPNFSDNFKWFYPGIGIKRWVILGAVGVLFLIFGASRLRTEDFWVFKTLDTVILASGIIILILGIKMMMRSFIAAFMPSSKGTELVDILYHKKQLGRGFKIVTIGGGTGLSVLLTGLKEYTSNISAIVTVADDGGSSGRLRQQFDILPPGDIRNCLVALADAPALMRELFQFRFDTSSELAGHSFGNLFITAMTRVTGDFEKAIKETSKVLALRGKVIPSTLSNVVLNPLHNDGSTTTGEEKIPKAQKAIKRVYLSPEGVQATPDALKAIKDAQVIILGPGSLYTSIIPNLLIKEITEAIASSPAIKVYVCNVMTQPGETDGYTAADHLDALHRHGLTGLVDVVLVNDAAVSPELVAIYHRLGARPVVVDEDRLREAGVKVTHARVAAESNVVRHDSERLAQALIRIVR